MESKYAKRTNLDAFADFGKEVNDEAFIFGSHLRVATNGGSALENQRDTTSRSIKVEA